MPSSTPWFIVFNAASGSHDAVQATERLAERLHPAGQPYTLHLVRRAADLPALTRTAVAQARSAGGLVVAAGGDGTINQVAQAAWQADVPMGVLPQGTFNYFARSHGVPQDLDGAIDALLAAQPMQVQVGMVNERVFLVNASVGLYPRLLQDREQAKKRLGRHRIVAMASGLLTLLRGGGRLDLQLQCEGRQRRIRARTLLVGNNALQLRDLGLPEAHAVEHGQLAAISLKPLPALATLWIALRGVLGQLGGADGVEVFAFQQLRIEPLRRLRRWKVAIDGEVLNMEAPLRFHPAERPLRMWLPVQAPAAATEGPGTKVAP